MRAADFPPFEAAVEAGVAAVMCSYNRVNGSHACIPVWSSNLRLADLCCVCHSHDVRVASRDRRQLQAAEAQPQGRVTRDSNRSNGQPAAPRRHPTSCRPVSRGERRQDALPRLCDVRLVGNSQQQRRRPRPRSGAARPASGRQPRVRTGLECGCFSREVLLLLLVTSSYAADPGTTLTWPSCKRAARTSTRWRRACCAG